MLFEYSLLLFLLDGIGVPRCVRMDCGTENTLIEDIQKAFRWEHTDDMAGENSVIKGSSHANQVLLSCTLILDISGLYNRPLT